MVNYVRLNRSRQHSSRLKMLSKSEVQMGVLSTRPRGQARQSTTSLTCHSWELNFFCGPEIYYSVLLITGGGSKETWYVES